MNKLLLSFALAFGVVTSAFAGPADPGTYYDEMVAPNSSDVYYEYLLADGNDTYITLEGHCGRGQDVDLWVYDETSGNLIAKSTSNSCYETVSIITHFSSYIKIVVENQNKPFYTDYDLTVE